jgi:hypothetical protein
MTSNFDKLLSSIKWQDDLMSKMKGLDLSTQIARSFAHKSIDNNAVNALTGGMRGMITGLEFTAPFHQQLLAQRAAWEGIAGSLNHLVAMRSISENLAQTALLGQLGLHNSLVTLARHHQERFHNPFTAMDAAIRGMTDRVYRELEVDSSEKEIKEIAEVVESLGVIATEHAERDRPITAKDLENFRTNLLNELVAQLRRSKTARATALITFIMGVIGFVFQLYSTYGEVKDISNREALEQTRVYLDSLVHEALNDRAATNGFRWNTRVANRKVNLRLARSSRSEILDTIEEGEQVVVIAVMKKWLYVSYVDGATGEPRSGYVLKKYFDRE